MKKLQKLLLILLLFGGFQLSAQIINQEKPSNRPYDFWSHVRYGGNFGLSWSDSGFSGTIIPSAIYEFNRHVATGVGLNFTYMNGDNYKAFVYGGSLLAMVNPVLDLQISAELEQLRVNREFDYVGENFEDNFWNTGLYLGLGYIIDNFSIGVRYNVLYDDNKSIYSSPLSPFVRAYF